MLPRLGKFELLRSLGQGAMGEVFLARDPAIGREVAVKTILASTTAGEGAKERFAREAKAAGTLNHPGIVTIHEFGEDQGMHYLAMEFVAGDDLQDLLAARALPKADLLEILAQVSEALAYAHRKGVLHRDVKPSNLRITREGGRLQAKLMDFGIARMSESTLTSAGLLMGTVAYMAPEYVKTGQADPRGDLFAVGVMLYQGLAGQLPFAGDTTATILYRLVHEPPRPLPPSAFAGASPGLRGVLDRALAKEPSQRYPDGDALAAALRSAKDSAWPGEGTPTLTLTRHGRNPARRTGVLVAAAALLLALGGAAAQWRHRVVVPPSPVPKAVAPSPLPTAPSGPAPAPVSSAAISSSAPAPLPEATPESKPAPKPLPPPKAKPVPEPPPETASEPAALAEGTAGAAARPSNALAAAAKLDTDPAQAHRDLAALIQAHPGNAHLRALDLVALAKAGDGAGFLSAWDRAREAGVQPEALLLTPRFSLMLREQSRNPTLPEAALASLKAAYGDPIKGQRRWGRRGHQG